MPSGLIVNDVDLERWGIKLESPGGLTGALAMSVPVTQLAGSIGDVVTSPDPTADARIVTVPVYQRAATNAALKLAMEESLDHISVGPLEVRTSHFTDRMWLARFTSSTVQIAEPSLANTSLEARGTYTFRFVNPLALEIMPRSYALTTTGAAGRIGIMLGTGPTRPVLQIMGPATNPKVTLYDAFGVKVGEMNFTITLGANDFLGVDCWARKVTKSVASVVSSASDTRKVGDDFFNLLPRYGSAAAGRYVLLELSAGTMLVRARRSWKL